ncbi:MAG TPA: hypothetical protein ENJ62_02915 [Bryobacterales bacterium]|nr:hypothetical protein [Bryobacterales bacterium]
MKVGAEPKKVAILVGLLAVAAYLFYSNSTSDIPDYAPPPRPAAVKTSPAKPPAARPAPRRSAAPAGPRRTAPGSGRGFRPSLVVRRPEDRPDPMTLDPTLRLDLLAKLQQVRVEGVRRSLFEFGLPPALKKPEPKLSAAKIEEIKQKQREAIAKRVAAKPAKPPPPPIRLKFYGYISRVHTNETKAFFLDGDRIFIAGEGDVINKRYKVVKIGAKSAVVEDTRHDHRQTLRLEEIRG